MIIATIGHYKYKLKDISAAELFLKIINDSVQVDSNYFPDNGHVYSISNFSSEMNISIFQGELISNEDLEKIRKQASQKTKS